MVARGQCDLFFSAVPLHRFDKQQALALGEHPGPAIPGRRERHDQRAASGGAARSPGATPAARGARRRRGSGSGRPPAARAPLRRSAVPQRARLVASAPTGADDDDIEARGVVGQMGDRRPARPRPARLHARPAPRARHRVSAPHPTPHARPVMPTLPPSAREQPRLDSPMTSRRSPSFTPVIETHELRRARLARAIEANERVVRPKTCEKRHGDIVSGRETADRNHTRTRASSASCSPAWAP